MLQAHHSPKLSFHAFNICTFCDRVSKVRESQKHIVCDKIVFKPDAILLPVPVTENNFAFWLDQTHFFGSVIVMLNHTLKSSYSSIQLFTFYQFKC